MASRNRRPRSVRKGPKPPSRADKLYNFGRKDPFEAKQKLNEPTRCPSCGALFAGGRWTWEEPEEGARVEKALCPACRREQQGVPAGIVELRGDFLRGHFEEIRNLILNVEERKKERSPLERIMKTRSDDGVLHLETTSIHLARSIGEALESAYEGELGFTYLDGEYRIQVEWER